MGKQGGFLEYERHDPGYRPVDERVKDFNAVEKELSEEELKVQAARCMSCGTPFCHTTGCPLGNVIPEWNDMVYKGRWQDALELLLATCSFPEFTGRLCPALCEGSCVLGINDDPVAIRQVELEIIERGFNEGYMVPKPPKSRLNKSVAVVGSGPGGLAVADWLNKAGVNVTVYDNAEKPGGILRYGIPDFKIEKWVIDRRIDLMVAEGIVFENGVTVGDDISYNYLDGRFDAICLAAGARDPRNLPVEGRDLDGVHFAMDFLTLQNRVNGGEIEDVDISAKGKNVVVIGGGDTGADCIGTSVRQGAKSVVQLEIMPKPPEERSEDTPWPKWPYKLRTSTSHGEGCDRRWSVTTKEFVGKDGKLTGLKCAEVGFEKTEDGRLSFPEKKGTEFTLEADLVVLALGFAGPGRNKLAEDISLELDSRKNILVDNINMTSKKGVFAAGDMARGQSLIVTAMADGRTAAKNIFAYLQEK